MNNGVLCTPHRFQFRINKKLKSGMEKYSNTIPCIAEIFITGQFATASVQMDHGTHISSLCTHLVQKSTRCWKSNILSICICFTFRALTIHSGFRENNSHFRRVTNIRMLGKLRELHALTLTQMDTAK